MKFEDALKAMREGKQVRRACWKRRDTYWALDGNRLVDETNNDGVHLVLNSVIDDLDWEIYEEPGNDFQWALEQFKKGERIRRRGWINGEFTCKDRTHQALATPGRVYDLRLTMDDVGADDWVLAPTLQP